MVSDSIPKASISMASSSNHRDFPKKKRANRSAKLKQCKLDARREQWLSQVKIKDECKEEADSREQQLNNKHQKVRPIAKFDASARCEEDAYFGDVMTIHRYADFLASPPISPRSHASSILGSNNSGTNFTSSRSGSSSGRSISSSSNDCLSGNMSEEDEGDDGCLDDWEAIADALAATDEKQHESIRNSGFDLASTEKYENDVEASSMLHIANQQFSGIDVSNATQGSKGTNKQRASPVNTRAWRFDDAYRPQGLPNLTKQVSCPLKSEQRFGCGGSGWGCKNLGQVPTSCPICFEDFDYTDSSFRPCSCGFRLCLFCHKRIIEEDGRCPGCRKQYEHDPVGTEALYDDGGKLSFPLARSCSMFTRS